ncbi:MAG: hypothetical protein QM500_13945 [Methylococcales bacterium]
MPVLPNGNLGNIFYSVPAKVIFLDEFDQQYAERDPVGGEVSGGGGLSLWVNSETYNVDDIVRGSNGQLYESFTAGNTGNDPVTSPTFWEEVRFIGVWNTNITYIIGDVVQSSLGNLWKALTATAANDPETDNGTNWKPAIDGAKSPAVINIVADIVTVNNDISALSALNSWDTLKTSDFTGVASESRQIDASANTIDVTLPALSVGDSFIYHNLITSTFKVQILNPIETIKGTQGDIAAATNLELEPGQSVQMIAKTVTVLSIVGVFT